MDDNKLITEEESLIDVGSEAMLDGDPFIVTEDDLIGSQFTKITEYACRCTLCGHKFQKGDVVRFQYTNNSVIGYGNAVVCEKCDGTRDEIVAKMAGLRAEFMSDKYWWFRKSLRDANRAIALANKAKGGQE